MWTPKRIRFDNLFSHRHSEYEFREGRCVVIFGKNEDDKGTLNNGAGKSTLFEAIALALTNDTLRSLRKDMFIRRDAAEAYVEMELENKVLRSTLKITRKFYRNSKPVQVEIWENGELNRQITSVAEANARITELIGISRDDLLRYYIISQDNDYTFFTASDTDKKEVLNRITSADLVNPIIGEIDARCKKGREDVEALKGERDKAEARLSVLREQREETLRNDGIEDEVNRIKERIQEARERCQNVSTDCEKERKRISVLTDAVKAVKVPDTEALRNAYEGKRRERDKTEEEVAENKTLERKLRSEVDLSLTCPNCGKEFIPDTQLENLSPDEIRDVIKEVVHQINQGEQALKDADAALALIRGKIREAEKIEEERRKQDSEISRAEDKVRRMEDEIRDIGKRIASDEKRIREILEDKKREAALKSLDKKIEAEESAIRGYEKSIAAVEEEYELSKFWQFHMGRNGFMTYLANKSVKVIEGVTNSFLKRFGTDISVVINGFKLLRTGEVREKIDVFVTNDGLTAEPFMSKSGGERGRVTLAGILGIQHLINLSLNGRGLDLLLMDESLATIDTAGQERIIRTMERLGITIIFITQNVSEAFNNENTLMVVKQGGVSRYVF